MKHTETLKPLQMTIALTLFMTMKFHYRQEWQPILNVTSEFHLSSNAK